MATTGARKLTRRWHGERGAHCAAVMPVTPRHRPLTGPIVTRARLYRNPLVKRMIKQARLDAVTDSVARSGLKLSLARWRFAGAAAVAVRWRHRCTMAEQEVARLRAE